MLVPTARDFFKAGVPYVEVPSPCQLSCGSHLQLLGSIRKHSDSKYCPGHLEKFYSEEYKINYEIYLEKFVSARDLT